MAHTNQRYSFIVEWYDSVAAKTNEYYLYYYPYDKTIEMFDFKANKGFLRRIRCDTLKFSDLYKGSLIVVFTRQLRIIGYADNYTKEKFHYKAEVTLALIKPAAVKHASDIFDEIFNNGLIISRLQMCHLNKREAAEFYAKHAGNTYLIHMIEHMSANPTIAFEIVGDNALSKWRKMLGPKNPQIARQEAPESLRARFGKDIFMNACHGSKSPEEAFKEIEFFFPSNGKKLPCTPIYGSSTFCLIKPHAVRSGLIGKIIRTIYQEGFGITAMKMYQLSRVQAGEFLEVYKGVLEEFPLMVDELVSGTSLALEISADIGTPQEVQQAFRKFCGPYDPEIARRIEPRTLRALFGVNKLQNAVHCTDLPDDGLLENQYFFQILHRN